MRPVARLAIWLLGAGIAPAQPSAHPPRDDGRAAVSQPAPVAPGARTERRWTVSLVTGVPSTAPLRAFEDTMRAAGFDAPSGGCVFGLCFAPTPMPYSMHARAYRDTWSADVNRRLRRGLGVGLVSGRSLLGWTTGRHDPSGAFFEVETAVTHVVPVVTFMPAAGVRVGAGPGLFTTTFTRTGPERQTLDTVRRPGLLAAATLTFPRRTRVFVELSGQERWLARQPFGPVDVQPAEGVVFPESRVRVSHWFIGLGIGVRF
jgi:hypothetical protein